jgi:phosphoribosylanthranilate isomerase
MKVKICGITRIDDAEAAIASGADYIGLIFVEGTPRCLSLDMAQRISESVAGRAKVVGVFQDQSPNTIEKIAKTVRLDLVQLHGDESPDMCKQIELPVIKAISPDFEIALTSSDRVKAQSTVEHLLRQIDAYGQHCQHILIDRCKSALNSDWLIAAIPSLAQVENQLGRYFLAGGLSEERLPFLLGRVKPFCLDVSSAVEVSPGKKDHELVKRFCNAARRLTFDQAPGEAKTC